MDNKMTSARINNVGFLLGCSWLERATSRFRGLAFSFFKTHSPHLENKAKTLTLQVHQVKGKLWGAIARALVSALRPLLLDEPSVGLSPLLVSQTITFIAKLKKRGTFPAHGRT
jgi:ABC-type branched-subunit amino acid transport system ATPase component